MRCDGLLLLCFHDDTGDGALPVLNVTQQTQQTRQATTNHQTKQPPNMATSPPLSPSTAATKASRVEDWIQQLSELASAHTDPFSPPSTPENYPSLKRKRKCQDSSASCSPTMPTTSNSSKRPRRNSDEVLPVHSVSAVGAASNVNALVLNEGNTFALPSSTGGSRSSRRPPSPSRDDAATLAFASPPTITGPGSILKAPPPQKVRDTIQRLEDGLDRGWIPSSLRKPIEDDQDLGYQMIEPHAWAESTAPSLAGLSVSDEEQDYLSYVLRKVKKICLNAQVCETKGRDENAWCMDVVKPLIKLAMKLEGEDKFWLQSVWVAIHLFDGALC
jgi:hypothetical protein